MHNDFIIQFEFLSKRLNEISNLFVTSFNLLILHSKKKWWAKVDSNHRPHDYQSCALASWAIGPYRRNQIHNLRILCKHQMLPCGFVSPLPNKPASLGFAGGPLVLLVESTGIEPVTSCLQGRRSPSWANPPGFFFCSDTFLMYPLNWITHQFP